MASVQALILAAGRGSRLGRSGDDVPKCLLEIGRRRLIEHQLDLLADAGVGPVRVVVGYGATEVREVVGQRAEFVVNTRWEATNSLYSFWLGRETSSDDLLVLNCDVLFAPELLERLLDCPGSALAIDSGSGQAREQMKVRLEGGRVIGMAKDLPADQAAGENVGVFKLNADAAAVAFDHAGRLIEQGHERSWVGAAISALARERELRTVDVAGLPWVEIDFPVDLDRARKETWPAIRGKTHRRQRAGRIASMVLGSAALLTTAALMPRFTRPAVPPPAEWDTLVLEDLVEERIAIGEQSQNWWLLENDLVAEAVVTGPGPVRVESRLVGQPSENQLYVLEVLIDGEMLDWYKLSTRPSGKASHPRWAVSHKKRITLDVPDGRHVLRVRLVAPQDAVCVMRVRQPESDTETDSPRLADL